MVEKWLRNNIPYLNVNVFKHLIYRNYKCALIEQSPNMIAQLKSIADIKARLHSIDLKSNII